MTLHDAFISWCKFHGIDPAFHDFAMDLKNAFAAGYRAGESEILRKLAQGEDGNE